MITVRNLIVRYGKGKNILTGLDLDLQPDHIYGLLGKNGAGKSTLLKSIAGLVYPDRGTCMINGTNAAKRDVTILEDLYFLPEDVFVPELSPAKFYKRTGLFYPKFSRSEFYDNLKILDVNPEADMHKISYGQQKKAMIAFGLATNTNLLILDEPTNGLDIPSKVQFRKLIASALNEERCILISTHQVRDLESLIDTVLILDEQRIVVKQTVDELSNALDFGTFEETEGLPVLYEEDTIRGKYAILKNTTGKYSRLDLELLFNAVTGKSEQLIQLLQKGNINA